MTNPLEVVCEERARIVAVLRDMALEAELNQSLPLSVRDELDAAADAIERGP